MANPSDSTPDETEDPEARKLTDLLLDALVYAPIGLTLDGQELTPELARRGRQHAAAARQIGEFAVKTGLQRLDGLIASKVAGEPDSANASAPSPATPPVDTEPEPPEPESLDEEPPDDGIEIPSSEHLAIPDYDLLAASQVVRRLDGLDADQLEAVRLYEAATRDRRTILHKIARLQD